MRTRRFLIVVLSVFLAHTLIAAELSPAAKTFNEGTVQLSKADFDGALKTFAAAAKADPENVKYREAYAMVRKVVKMREALPAETNAEKWETLARGLRSFYYMNGIYSESLAIDQQLNNKLKTPEAATMLAESQLALDKNEDAAKTIEGIDKAKLTPAATALSALAQARQKNADAAKAQLAAVKTDKPEMPVLLLTARTQAVLGNNPAALEALKATFENTPPNRLGWLKNFVNANKDFAALRTDAAFADVLKTPSKIKESACSGGSDCGSCSSASSCPSKKGGTASGAACDKEKAGACPSEKK